MTAPRAPEPSPLDTPAGASAATRDPGSYRDPAGFVFRRDGVVYRQIDASFAKDWDQYLESGLYERMADAGIVIRHEDTDVALAADPPAYRVIRPEPLELISYPYEWSFSQLQDAALLTLQAQALAEAPG